MRAYLVRLGETGDGSGQNVHELVGIFCAQNMAQLIELVDEFCEPRAWNMRRLDPAESRGAAGPMTFHLMTILST
jgi:hypothetical protein